MQDIRDDIEEGRLRPGDPLPSEKELGEHFGLSRMSVRKGLTLLVEKGFVTSVAGKGHYVRRPESTRYVLPFDETRHLGRPVTRVQLAHMQILGADRLIAQALDVPQERRVIRLQHVFWHDQEIMAFDEKYFAYVKGSPFVEEEIGYSAHPLTALQSKYAFSLRTSLRIGVGLADESARKMLRVRAPHPVLVVERSVRDSSGTPIMWSRLFISQEYGVLDAYATP